MEVGLGLELKSQTDISTCEIYGGMIVTGWVGIRIHVS